MTDTHIVTVVYRKYYEDFHLVQIEHKAKQHFYMHQTDFWTAHLGKIDQPAAVP